MMRLETYYFSNPKGVVSMNSLKLIKREGGEERNRSKQIFLLILFTLQKSEIVFQSNFPQKKEMMFVFRVQVWVGAL